MSASELLPRQPLVGFEVFGGGLGDDVGGEHGAGWGFVPVEGFEVVADELLVEAGLATAGGVLVGGPEARGVGGEDFVYEDQPSVAHAELELGVGDDDAALAGVVAAGAVEGEAEVAGLRGEVGADDAGGFGEGDVFVVPGLGLGGGG